MKRLPGLFATRSTWLLPPIGSETEHARVHASAIDSVGDVAVIDARALSPTRQLVIATARVNAVLAVEVDGDQYSRYRESRELPGDYLEPFASASWYESAEPVVRFSLVLNEEGTDLSPRRSMRLKVEPGTSRSTPPSELRAHLLRDWPKARHGP